MHHSVYQKRTYAMRGVMYLLNGNQQKSIATIYAFPRRPTDSEVSRSLDKEKPTIRPSIIYNPIPVSSEKPVESLQPSTPPRTQPHYPHSYDTPAKKSESIRDVFWNSIYGNDTQQPNSPSRQKFSLCKISFYTPSSPRYGGVKLI